MNSESLPNKPVFDGFFISYLAQINGFKEACKPFIGLDGTLLKVEVGGVLLSATSKDASNHMFLLLWGWLLVTKENKNN